MHGEHVILTSCVSGYDMLDEYDVWFSSSVMTLALRYWWLKESKTGNPILNQPSWNGMTEGLWTLLKLTYNLATYVGNSLVDSSDRI